MNILSKLYIPFLTAFILLFGSCEDQIELNLKDADPKIVITGGINNLKIRHRIQVQRTVPLKATEINDPVSAAQVQIADSDGAIFHFEEKAPGIYESEIWAGKIGRQYTLTVTVDDQQYRSVSTIPPPVEIDSIGTSTRSFFGTVNYYVSLKFNDPAGVSNQYRYLLGINDGPLKYAGVYNDKFTDGRQVSHDLSPRDMDLMIGDVVLVQRESIDMAVFDYWSQFDFANPGQAAPANPQSNIDNGALGYFSAFSVLNYLVEIQQ